MNTVHILQGFFSFQIKIKTCIRSFGQLFIMYQTNPERHLAVAVFPQLFTEPQEWNIQWEIPQQLINRPGVARAVLQSPPSLIN